MSISTEHESLLASADKLDILTSHVEQHLASAASLRMSTYEDKRLLNAAQECKAAAGELRDAVNKLIPKFSNSVRCTFLTGIRSAFSKRKINALRARLEVCHAQVDTAMLVRMM